MCDLLIKIRMLYKRNSLQIVLILYFIFTTIWWVSIQYRGLVDTNENYYYGIVYGLIPFLGGIFGILNAKKWSLESYIGKSLLFLSLGLFTWSMGNLFYGYYNLFLSIEVPYPSLADFVYILSWPFWTIGLVYMLKVLAIKSRLKVFSGRFLFLSIPLLVFAASYYLLFLKAREGTFVFSDDVLKLFFDISYPAGDVVVLTLTLLIYALSVNYLGGLYKRSILIVLFALAINYFGDFIYAYMTTIGSFYVAGPVDYIYTVVMFLFSFGVSRITPSLLKES